ncbi:hypothetical protein B0675_26450 [Streptomyces sp. M41(2017)]|nr:hypothetical protein B0675_26450 [Streptomyces sp. M41(2017)]
MAPAVASGNLVDCGTHTEAVCRHRPGPAEGRRRDLAPGRRSRSAAAVGGLALLAGSACTRFGVFAADISSAHESKARSCPSSCILPPPAAPGAVAADAWRVRRREAERRDRPWVGDLPGRRAAGPCGSVGREVSCPRRRSSARATRWRGRATARR